MATSYEELRQMVQSQSATARTDIEKSIEDALNSLSTKSQEAMGYITELEKSPTVDATKWVSTAKGQIEQSVQGLLETIMDFSQRTGIRGGAPGIGSAIEATVNALTPMTGQLTREANQAKSALGVQKAGLTERLGVVKAGFQESRGKSLAGITGSTTDLMTKIGQQEAAELAAIEAKKQELANALAIAGKLTDKSTADQLSSLGVTANLGKILNQPNVSGGTSGTGGTGGSDLSGMISQLDALKKMQWVPGEPSQIQTPGDVPLYFAGQERKSIYSQLMSQVGRNLSNLQNYKRI